MGFAEVFQMIANKMKEAKAQQTSGSVPPLKPPPPSKRTIYLRGPGSEAVEITPETQIEKPAFEPRTLVIDGKEYQMSNISQANTVMAFVQQSVDELKNEATQNAKQFEDATTAQVANAKKDATTRNTENTNKEIDDKRKALAIAQARFKTDVVPQIQEGLNAQGLLESGATPEALANALASSASSTTAEEVNQLLASTMKRYAPSLISSAADFSRGLNQHVFNQGVNIDAVLHGLQLEGQTPDMSQTLPYQLGGLGAGVGGGMYRNYRRNKLLADLMRTRPGGSGTLGGYNGGSGSYGTNLDYYVPGQIPF